MALITGGASGLGKATAHAFAAAGMTVAIADLDLGKAKETAAGLPGDNHRGFALDVVDEAQVADTFATVEAQLSPIAVLGNFAGIMIWPSNNARPSIVDTPIAEWERTYAVNCRGTFLCIREFLRQRASKPVADGRIINIASSAAQIGGYNASAAYISSKGAILSLTKVAAREAAPLGITVNSISPGAIDTPLLRSVMSPDKDAAYCARVPVGRVGRPEEIAAAAAYLASPAAGYVTGTCLDVNGGIWMT